MKKEYTEQEINWKTINIYIDVETGELLEPTQLKQSYTILNKQKVTNVYKKTGTTTYYNVCRKLEYRQSELFGE